VRSELGGEEAVVYFRIEPPWYLSTLAFVVYVLIFLGLLWFMEIINRRRLERQRDRLETEKEREILVLEVENKSRELSNAAFNLIRKNEALQSLKDNLLDSKNEPRALSRIVREIDSHLEGDHDWELFEASFNRVYDDFFKRLMQTFPDLTPGDLRLAAYLKMNLSSKEIAPLLNISVRGIENKRYRLRKKIGLSEDANLTEFIMAF
jgi:DNA-binding CsgD family transcriptional regulator